VRELDDLEQKPRSDGADAGQSAHAALIARLRGLYRTLSRTNAAIAHADSESALLNQICQIVVEHDGFVLAWIGFLGADGRLRASAAAGAARGCVTNLELAVDASDPAGGGPCGRALRLGVHVISHDFLADPRNAPWHAKAREHGIRGAAVIPLLHDGRVSGVFAVYSDRVGQFDAPEVALLDDIGTHLAMGLAHLKRTAAMQRLGEQRELLYQQLSEIERTVRVGVLQLTVPNETIWWSAGVPALLGLPADTPPAWNGFREALGAAGLATLRAAITAAVRSDQELDIDLPLAGRRATPAWIRIFGRVEAVDGGIEANATMQDVSERRLIATQINQATAAERQRLLSDLHDNLGQVLAGAGLLAAAHERDVRAVAPTLAESARQLVSAVTESQRLCRDLAHGLLEDFTEGLAVVLQRLAARTSQTGIGCSFNSHGESAAALSEVQCRELFRIAQEAVTNALKHAACRQIDIALNVAAATVDMTVSDDGIGIDPARMVEGLGMRTMRYRAARIGTTVHVEPAERAGTRVRLSVPRV
jgi:signal transduction histidine kinase/putative methionine-R-sulfoxide reductase with GAF domain